VWESMLQRHCSSALQPACVHLLAAVHAGPLDSPAAAHKAVRGMIAHTLRDPYTKFISPKVTIGVQMTMFLLLYFQCSSMHLIDANILHALLQTHRRQHLACSTAGL
jgi:hypothetical protein